MAYEPAARKSSAVESVFSWYKTQELSPAKYTLWDHCFELPRQNLQAVAQIRESVQVGQVTHPLRLDVNAGLEIYDYPGEYAQRFDGVGPLGSDQPAELAKIFSEKDRVVRTRMEQEAAAGINIQGSSSASRLVAGHKFTLARHHNANGDYVLTGINHLARVTFNADKPTVEYANTFTCIPAGLPFRPARVTPKPNIPGSQTAVVTGPAGEEIFIDKYARVKVQFHWDRQGQNDAQSSAWVRVGSLHAGTEAGFIASPRIGQEVIVSFLEGDPDRPIIIGSVYNAGQLP